MEESVREALGNEMEQVMCIGGYVTVSPTTLHNYHALIKNIKKRTWTLRSHKLGSQSNFSFYETHI